MLIIGHRGAAGMAPENTIASLQAALDAGADVIEFDARVTADGVPVLVHDPFVASKEHVVAQTEFKELKELKHDLVTLEEALRFLKNQLPVIIEVKPGVDFAPVAASIRARLQNEWKAANISLASFDFKLLRQAKAELPDITLIVNEPWSGVRAGRRANRLGTKYITMNQKWLWSGFIRMVTRNGTKLSAYIVNDPAKARRWEKLGLHAVVTDFPDRFKV